MSSDRSDGLDQDLGDDPGLQLGVELDVTQHEQLRVYQELVTHWNKTFNLVSRQDVGRFVPRHLADSLSIYSYMTGERAIDIGTGAGLPGIPLAVAAPERHMTLVERSAKKIRFLKQVVRRLDLHNVRVLNIDVQDLATTPAEQGRYQRLVSRAVMPPDALWAKAASLLAPGGAMVLHTAVQQGTVQQGTVQAALSNVNVDHFPGLDRLETHAQAIPGLQSTHQILVLYR